MHVKQLVVTLSSVAALAMNSGQEDKVVPVHQEPRHHLKFDAPGTRILDIQIPPGDTTLFHTHSDPILYVIISTSQMRSQTLGAEWSGEGPISLAAPATSVASAPLVSTTPPGGLMSTTTYADKPLTHRVHNAGSSLYRLIGTTTALGGDTSLAPGTDFAGKPELDNRWFRAYRWTLSAAGEEHRHANAVNVVAVSGSAVAVVGDTNKTLDQPGAFVFIESNQPHRLHRTAAGSQVVEIEIRRPR